MTKRYLGNIITQNPTAPTGNAANGVWSLAEVTAYKKATAWPTLPEAATIGTATDSETGGKIEVAFTPPAELYGGTISQYTATSSPGSITGNSTSSPTTVSGLTNGTSYTFTVSATTGAGTGPLSSASNSVAPSQADRGIFMAGQVLGGSYATNTIDYINIKSSGNATDFGNLSEVRGGGGAAASSTRALCMGGGDIFGAGGSVNYSARIDYVTISTTGNSSIFGNLTASRRSQMGGLSNSTRGCQMFAQNSNGSYSGFIEYVTIATTGNAANFGELSETIANSAACFASPTRGVFCGGNLSNNSLRNQIEYITIASTGNSTDFGDLASASYRMGGTSSDTRGLATIYTNSDYNSGYIQYVTIASTGNATTFGNLSNPGGSYKSSYCSATSNNTTAVIHEGYNNSAGGLNVVSSVTIASTGNAADFGDLTVARFMSTANSGTHGGLQ